MTAPTDSVTPRKKIALSGSYVKRSTPILMAIATLAFLTVWLWPFQPIGEGLKTNAPLHTVLEIFSIVVASAIFAVGWHGYNADGGEKLSIIASGFLGVALMDTAHLLSFTGMPDWVTPAGNGKAIYFWFGARFLAIGSILIFLFYHKRPRGAQQIRWFLLFLGLAGLALLTWLVLYHTEWLPVFFIKGTGLTPAKVALEWLLILLGAIALFLVFRMRKETTLYDSTSLMASFWMMILSELCFTLYSDAVDIFGLTGHVFKVFSYAYLYRALVVGSVKRPYELLNENREILKQLISNVRFIFWLRTADRKKILFVSDAFQEIFQQPCENLINNPDVWQESVHPEDLERLKKILHTAEYGDFDQNYRIIRPDGTLRWIRSRTFPIHDAQGETVRLAGVAEDITDTIIAAESRKKSEERYRALMKTASDGIHIVDESGTLIDASDSLLRALGYDEGVIGRLKVWQWDKNTSKEYVLDTITELLNSGAPRVLESEFIRSDGTTFPAEVYIRGVTINGQNLIYASARDITERRNSEAERLNLQRQLDQAQKMEAIGHLAGGIAHDFNNMLGVILGYSELIKIQDSKSNGNPLMQKYVREITAAGERAKELVAQMLIFSRTGQEISKANTLVVDLQSVVKEVFRFARSSIPSTIDVDFTCEDDSLRVKVTPVQLHQIILNLAINARDAMGEYGKIHIGAGRKAIANTVCAACHAKFSGDYIVLAVSDTGKGISPQIMTRIFEPFFTTKEVGKGTGMGLSVVHGLVHSAGGHILVESQENTGTTISILLPIATQNTLDSGESRGLRVETLAEPLRGKRIMVVDDEQTLGAMMEEILSIHGAEVTVFRNSKQAESFFARDPDQFDMVITDETMPELSGADLSQKILMRRPTLPIILCTGYSERVNEDSALALGIGGYLQKPVNPKTLIEMATALCVAD